MKLEWRRVGAASATVSAGALVFFSAGTGTASAEPTGITEDCKLGPLLCGIMGSGAGTPTAPPKSSGDGTSTKPAPSRPKPKPKPAAKAKAKPAAHPRHAGSSGGSAGRPAAPPADMTVPAPPVVSDPQAPMPSLPDLASQDPVVVPEAAPGGQAPRQAVLVASDAPADGTTPPLLVATAAGLIGGVAALNLSIMSRRRS